MLMQILGDPSGMLFKCLACFWTIWYGMYNKIMAVPRTKAKYRAQCPNLRLGIDGQKRGDRQWNPETRRLCLLLSRS